MTHRGPFQPRTFRDSVILSEWDRLFAPGCNASLADHKPSRSGKALNFHQKIRASKGLSFFYREGSMKKFYSTKASISLQEMGFMGLLMNKLRCSFVGEMNTWGKQSAGCSRWPDCQSGFAVLLFALLSPRCHRETPTLLRRRSARARGVRTQIHGRKQHDNCLECFHQKIR